jgi:murein L,D-transpeptidase YafK
MKGCLLIVLLLAGLGFVYLKRDEIAETLRLPMPTAPPASADGGVTPLLRAELAALGLKPGDPVFIRIFKESRELELWLHPAKGDAWTFYKTYPLCGDVAELGPKTGAGEKGAPEGFYYATSRQLQWSRGKPVIDLGYPNPADRQRKQTGKPARLEGGCVPKGSYAIGDAGMEELFTLARVALANGQAFVRMHCFPFRMTDERMNQEMASRSKWLDFWANLKEGYDYFEVLHRPPNATAKKGKYDFE